MARMALNLSLRSIETFSLLIHGGPGAGKTHLMGDALAHELNSGPVAYINIKGQDGWLALAEYDLGDSITAETVETLTDFTECMSDLKTMNLGCVAVDSIRDLYRLCVTNTTGDDRPPKGGANENEYTQIYHDFERALRIMKDSAKRVVTCSTSDRSTDQLTGRVNIVPDLPGRQGMGVASLFDFVGYLSAAAVMGRTKRLLSFQTMTISVSKTVDIAVLTRQRLARAIESDIEIPKGRGGWLSMLNCFEEHLVAGEAEPPKKKWNKKSDTV